MLMDLSRRLSDIHLWIAGLRDPYRKALFREIKHVAVLWSFWLLSLLYLSPWHHPLSSEIWFIFICWSLFSLFVSSLLIDSCGDESRRLNHFIIDVCVVLVLWILPSCILYPATLAKRRFLRIYVYRPPRYRSRRAPCIDGCHVHKSTLCNTCDRMIESSALLTGTRWLFTKPVEVLPYLTWAALGISAQSCYLCYIMRDSLPNVGKQNTWYGTFSGMTSEFGSIQLHVKLEASITRPGDTQISLILANEDFERTWGTPRVIPVQTIASLKCQSKNTAEARQFHVLAKSWIEQCQSHPNCQDDFTDNEAKHFHPTRLLDVQDLESEAIRLITISDISKYEPFRYLALSHCWGALVPLRLLSSTYDEMATSIDMQSMPQTFQDAVRITRSLGIRYLWIDSLCIIQDSPEDWERESSMMGLIYASALCTIAAAAAIDSSGGCFFDRDSSMDTLSLRSHGDQSLIIRPANYGQRGEVNTRLQLRESTWHMRAWTFQEWILSRRILYFCKDSVIFECSTMRASEYVPGGNLHLKRADIRIDGRRHGDSTVGLLELPASPYAMDAKQRLVKGVSTRPFRRPPSPDRLVTVNYTSRNPQHQSSDKVLSSLLGKSLSPGRRGSFELLVHFKGTTLSEKIEFHRCWFSLVQEYSKRHLTKPSDRLVALVGIAYFIQKSTSFIFVAGVWKETLLFDLLWKSVHTPTRRRRSRFPTWSWASVGMVTPQIQDDRAIGPVNPNKLVGNQEMASKHLARAFRDHWLSNLKPLVTNIEIVNPSGDGQFVYRASLWMTGHVTSVSPEFTFTYFDTEEAKNQFRTDYRSILVLPVLEITRTGKKPKDVAIHGLLVRRLLTGSSEYERVGYCCVQGQTDIDSFMWTLGEEQFIELK